MKRIRVSTILAYLRNFPVLYISFYKEARLGHFLILWWSVSARVHVSVVSCQLFHHKIQYITMYEAMRPQKAHIVCNTHQHQSDKLSTFYLHNLDLNHTFMALWQQQVSKISCKIYFKSPRDLLLLVRRDSQDYQNIWFNIIYLNPLSTC